MSETREFAHAVNEAAKLEARLASEIEWREEESVYIRPTATSRTLSLRAKSRKLSHSFRNPTRRSLKSRSPSPSTSAQRGIGMLSLAEGLRAGISINGVDSSGRILAQV